MSITYKITSFRSPLNNTIGELDEAKLIELARQFKTAELREGRVRKIMIIRKGGKSFRINLQNVSVFDHLVTVGDVKEAIASQPLTKPDSRLKKLYEKYIGKVLQVETANEDSNRIATTSKS